MNFWRRDISNEPERTRADVIIQKKRRKQDPRAKGLAAVSIPRVGARSIHQRNEDRHVLEGSHALAMIAGKEHEVRLLNLSSNGLMIGFDGVLEIGESVRIAIADCAPVTTAVRWVQNGRVGLEFASETVIIAEAGVQDFIIKTIAREIERACYRPDFKVGAEQRGVEKRHLLVWVGKLRHGEREYTARLRNVSATGAMISLSEPGDLANRTDVELKLDGLRWVPARVRWSIGQQLGVEFKERFDVSELIAISCAELAPEDEPVEIEEGKEPAEGEPEPGVQEDFDSLRIRLANPGQPLRHPGSIYTRMSLDEVYDKLQPDQRKLAGPGED